MYVSIVRTAILYIIIVLVLRLLGKRQIGQLQPFELVVILMIAELATIPSQDISVPLLSGLLPVLVLLFLAILTAQLTLKSQSLRRVVCGQPTLVIDKGIILEDVLRQQRYNLSDLLEQLRVNNVFHPSDVAYAILETNGEISVFLKEAKRPATPEDFQLQPRDGTLPLALIMDGVPQLHNITFLGLDVPWLKKQLKSQGAKRIEDVLLAYTDTEQNLYVQLKAKPPQQ